MHTAGREKSQATCPPGKVARPQYGTEYNQEGRLVDVCIDASIAGLVDSLNKAHYTTDSSCSGIAAEHPGESLYSELVSTYGYISFRTLDNQGKSRITRAAIESGLEVSEYNDTFVVEVPKISRELAATDPDYPLEDTWPDARIKEAWERFHRLLEETTQAQKGGGSVASAHPLIIQPVPMRHPSPGPAIIEQFPWGEVPERMQLGGELGKLDVPIPPPRGAPTPPKKLKIEVGTPRVLTMAEYERYWKPQGWRLLTIGPTSTWRQDWGDWEAIRDIVQNCLDEAESYQWGYDDQGLWIADQGRGVGVADFLLGPPKLKPKYARGRFGEGMKIGALALLRQGYSMHVSTVGRELWIIFLEQEVDGKALTLAALWREDGTSRGTKFHIIGYTGPAYADRFAVNLDRAAIIWESPSLVTEPEQRFNQLIQHEYPVSPPSGWYEKGGVSRIFARDIYLRDITGPYSYNLWSFDLAPDRHAPAKEDDLWIDVGRLWSTVDRVDLLTLFLQMVKEPAILLTDESVRVIMNPWDMGTDPTSGKAYSDILKDNQEAWEKAWEQVMGANAVIRTREGLDNVVKHLGYQPVSVSYGVREALKGVIATDETIKQQSQERLRETEVVPDDHLGPQELAHLTLARAIARNVLAVRGVSGVYASIIPPASDRVRTAGMYGTTTQAVYLNLEVLSRGRSTVDTLIHELAHHRQYRSTGEAEDLTPGHAEAMTFVAARVVQDTASGTFSDYLKDVIW